MRFNDRTHALLGIPDLPIDAFRHIGDRKIKPQGGAKSVMNTVSSVVSAPLKIIETVAKPVVQVAEKAVSTVSNVAAKVDDVVNKEIPGGWGTVAVLAGGAALASGALGGATAATAGTAATVPTAASYGGVLGAGSTALTGGAIPAVAAGAGGLLSSGSPLAGVGTGAAGVAATQTALTPATVASMGGILGGGSTALTGGVAPAVGGITASNIGQMAGSSSISNYLSGLTGIPADTISSFAPSAIQGLLSAGGSYLQSSSAKDAAQIQADAQIRAAQIAADAAKFRPVGVTTRFGTSNFQTDAAGNVIGAGYTASPEILGYQNRLSALASQGLTGAEQARTAYAPLTAGAQSLFGLGQNYLGSNLGQPLTDMSKTYMASQAGQPLTSMGQTYMNSQVGQPLTDIGLGYLKQTPEQVAADYITKQQALLAPTQENQLALLQNKLQQQGRTGLSVAQGGNLGATTPEMQAYYNALAQSNLQLAANANLAGQQQTQFGAGLYGQGVGLTQGQQLAGAGLYGQGTALTQAQQLAGANLYGQGINLTQQGQQFGGGLMSQGANLQNAYYTGQTAAYSPFTTAMDVTTGLENLAQTPMTLGTQIGAKTTASAAQAGMLSGQGIINAANTMAQPNAYSLGGNVLAGIAGSPAVTGALNKAFGVSTQPTQQQYTFNPATGQYQPVATSVFS